jgi:hypothetical protein
MSGEAGITIGEREAGEQVRDLVQQQQEPLADQERLKRPGVEGQVA